MNEPSNPISAAERRAMNANSTPQHHPVLPNSTL
jgi:hypothetical protein